MFFVYFDEFKLSTVTKLVFIQEEAKKGSNMDGSFKKDIVPWMWPPPIFFYESEIEGAIYSAYSAKTPIKNISYFKKKPKN